jgi:RHS repeat-associated protein
MRTIYRRLKALLLSAPLILVLGLVSVNSGGAFADTPHSAPRTCGYSGAPSCPTTTPDISAWRYWPGGPFYYVHNPNWFTTEQGLANWFLSYYTPIPGSTDCSDTLQPPTEMPPLQYSDGILIDDDRRVTVLIVYATTLNPPCASSATYFENYSLIRTVTCPAFDTMNYQASPQVGPSCSLPPATPDPPKQMGPGCPSCGTGSTSGNSGAGDAGSGQSGGGDGVNASNGNEFHSETDYSGSGTSPIPFTRYYNSMSAYVAKNYGTPNAINGTVIGNGWSATYFQYLEPASVTDSTGTRNTVYAHRANGRILIFNQYGSVYSPDADVADSLAQVAGGWQYQSADDTIETYNTAGQLLSIAARGRAPLTVSYSGLTNAGDPPASVSDPFGHTLTFTYGNGTSSTMNLLSVTDPAGNTIQYTYDTNANLKTVQATDGTTRTYGYADPWGNELLSSVTDEATVQYATWTYANYGRQVTSAQHAGGVDSYSISTSTYGTGGSITVTDPMGAARTFNQSLIAGAYRTTGTTGSACGNCGEDASRIYDGNGNVTSRTDFNGNQTTYAYDLQSNLETSRTEAYSTPRARTITTTWNAHFRQPALITLYAGGTATGTPLRTTGFTYDAMGNVLTKTITDTGVTPNVTRVWTNTYDTYGRILTADGPRTDVVDKTTYAYYTCTTGTQCGQLQTVTDAKGRVTTYNTYNVHGQPLTNTDPNGVVTTLTYDLRMRLTSRKVGTEMTSFSYWPTGLLEQVTLPDSSYIVYTYDGAHRLTQINDQLGNKVVYTLDNMGNRTAENAYDPSSNLHRTHTRVINSLNQLYQDVNAAGTAAVTTTFGYDLNGNQTSIAAPLARNSANAYDELNRLSQITDPASGITKFAYDAEDNLSSVVDPRTLTTSYTYTGFGDLKTQTSPDTGTTTNTYDSGGNLATSTDARGAVSTYAYDVLNRVTSVAYKIGSTTDQTITFTYDAGTNGIGRLTGASDANHSMSWTYDTLGRVTGKGQVVGTVTRSVGYGYTNGDLTSLVTPSGQTVVYGYNSNHQVISITINGTTLLNGVTYEPFGGVDKWTWGNATVTTRTFDTDQKITQISSQGVRTNTYDNAFRITQITNTTTGASTYTYGYDLLDHVTSGIGSANQTFTYDANGNRLTLTGTASETYTISPTSNRVTAINGTVGKTYSYDAAGNPLIYTPVTLAYNDRGRLKSVQTTSNTETLVYNALGQMIKVSGGSPGTVLYAYDEAGHLLGEYSSTGALVEETIWLGDIPVATLRPHSGGGIDTYYVHTDHLNTPHVVTRPSDNAQMWTWFQPSFGDSLPTGTLTYNLRFPGQIYDKQGGLFQNNRRDYDPAVGRYVESDPLGLRGGINTYAYVSNAPIMLTDRFGLQSSLGTALERAITILSKVCKKDSESCRAYWERINQMCLRMLFNDVAACSIAADTVNQPCNEGEAERITCKNPLACTANTAAPPS